MKKLLLTTAIIIALSNPALAEKSPMAGPVDDRIRTVVYSECNVMEIKGHYGYQTLIEFNRDEQIINVALGDSMAWYAKPNGAGNLLFVKPIESNATTNMTIITSKRTYHFELNAKTAKTSHAKDMAFHVQFKYPDHNSGFIEHNIDVVSKSNTAPSDWNFDYEFAGDSRQVPKRTFDDGDFTYFEFDKNVEVPAIFKVASDGTESLINYKVEGRYVVVQRIASQFTLRNGKLVTCIFNKSFDNSPNLDAGSPKKSIFPFSLFKSEGA